MIYVLLIDVMYRAGVRHEAPWDLLALVVFGGAACEAYLIRQKSPTRGWAVKAVLLACVTGIVTALLALVLPRWMH